VIIAAVAFVVGASLAAGSRPVDTPEMPVGIVISLKGAAWATSPSTPRQPLKAFDWVVIDTVIEVGRSSAVTIVFVNGARYDLGSQSRARTTSSSLIDRSGSVRQLPTLPPLPQVAPIAERASTTSGAVRIRGGRWPMFPSAPAAGVASATVLRFARLPQSQRYEIEVVDDLNSVVFATETSATIVAVPAGKLEPERTYRWRVRALDGTEEMAGEESFATLSGDQAASRQMLASRAAAVNDPALWALLGILDLRLGLLIDARTELRHATARGFDASSLAPMMERLDRRLDSVPEK
jgi:hypothetical protein